MSRELEQRIVELERDTRAQQHVLGREVSVERQITRDLVEALHKRVDELVDTQRLILDELRAQRGNGHAG